jgi:hypothetical protein
MGSNENRLAVWGVACASILAAPTASAAQRSEAPISPYGWSSSFNASSPRVVESPPPAPFPVSYATAELGTQPTEGRPHTYGSRGVVELGGFANFSGASNFTSIQFSPTAGLFVFDNLEVSVIVGLNYVHQTLDIGTPSERSEHKTILRVLGEPSYHLPLGSNVWAFVGVGLGVASVPGAAGGAAGGFDLSPRVGVNFLVGHSGLLTPAAFIDYTTGESILASNGNLLGVNKTYGLQAGYTVMW